MTQQTRSAALLLRRTVARAAYQTATTAPSRGLATVAALRPSFRRGMCSSPAETPLQHQPATPGANSGKISPIKHDMVHFKQSPNAHPLNISKVGDNSTPDEVAKYGHRGVPHPIWSQEEVNGVEQTHVEPKGFVDKLAYRGVKLCKWSFDTLSLYRFGKITKNKIMNRAIFLETVAAVPGMTAGMLRHLKSLRRMDHDHGWIHTLLEEAENERMHLLTFIQIKKPDLYFRTCVLITQGIFMNGFFVAYMLSPTLCHRFVGYLEEEAVRTYESILGHLANGDPELQAFGKEPAPTIAIDYWRMPADATMTDLFLAVRADEANHRDVNHTFATIPGDAEASHFFDPSGRPLKQQTQQT